MFLTGFLRLFHKSDAFRRFRTIWVAPYPRTCNPTQSKLFQVQFFMAMRTIRRWLHAFLGVVIFCAASSVAAERLIGLGVHQETGRDIYLGGLYLNDNTERPADLRNLAAPRVMEYRVVARRTSIRSLLGGMLLQSEIATGNQPSAGTTEFADALLSKIKSSLYAGDSLRIALTSNNETVATLNGHTVATISDPEVSNYLLAGWLNKNGASTQFRGALNAANIDPELLARLEATRATDERNAQIAASVGASVPRQDALPPANESVATNPDMAADVFQPESAPGEFAAPKASTPEIAQQTPTAPLQAEQLDKLPLAQTYPTAGSAAEPSATPPAMGSTPPSEAGSEAISETLTTADEAQPLPALNLEPTLDNLGTTTANERTTLDGLGDMQSARPSVSISSQNLGGLELDSEVLALGVREYSQRLSAFHNDLVSRVYRKIKYPKRAVRRNLEGRLELDITLRKSGELVAVAVAETSGHPLLDAAAVEAAEAAMAAANLSSLDAVAVAEFSSGDGRVVVPVPVNFQLTKK